MVPMMATAAGLAVLGGVVGLYASYHFHTAAGASIAVTMVFGYLTVAAVRRRAPVVAAGAHAG